MAKIKNTDIFASDALDPIIKEFKVWLKLLDLTEAQLKDILRVSKKGLKPDPKTAQEYKKQEETIKKVNTAVKGLVKIDKSKKDLNDKLITQRQKLSRLNTKSAREMALVGEAIKKQNTLLRANARRRTEAIGSLNQQRAQLIAVRIKYDALSKAERNNERIGGRLVKLNRRLDASVKKLEKSTGRTARNVGNYGSALKGAKTAMLGFIAGGVAGLAILKKIGAQAVKSIKAWVAQSEAETQLKTALGGTSQALLSQASALQKLTKFGDEETIRAQAYLAMMGLTEKQILKITPAIQDFASAKGIDLKIASDLVAKSIGSETNALSRYGVQIEGAVGSDARLESALASLTDKFGGQAEAVAILDGGIKQFNNAMGDTEETIGLVVVGLIDGLLPALTEQLELMNEFTQMGFKLRAQYKLTLAQAEKATHFQREFNAALEKGIDITKKEFKTDFLEAMIEKYGKADNAAELFIKLYEDNVNEIIKIDEEAARKEEDRLKKSGLKQAEKDSKDELSRKKKAESDLRALRGREKDLRPKTLRDFTDEQTKIIEDAYQDRINADIAYRMVLREAAIEDDKLEKIRLKKEADEKLKIAEDAARKEAELIKSFTKATGDLLKERSDKRISAIDKEISAEEKRITTLEKLANAGNEEAAKSLAVEQKRKAELQIKKERELRKQQTQELVIAGIETYSQKVAAGNKNALGSTITDITLLKQFISSLGSFFEGTELTGKGDIDNKGGFLGILHPNERIVPEKHNKNLKGISNEELGAFGSMYKNINVSKFNQVNPKIDRAVNDKLLQDINKNLLGLPSKMPKHEVYLDQLNNIITLVTKEQRGIFKTHKKFEV